MQPTTPQQPQVAPIQNPVVMQNGTQLDPGVLKVMKVVKQLETGGSQNPYSQIGDNGVALGAYQWDNKGQPLQPGQTPVNWQADAQTYLGNSHAPMTPGNQNQVAYSKMLQWKHEGYTPTEIDAMWNGAHKDEASGLMVHNNITRANNFNQLIAQQVSVPGQQNQGGGFNPLGAQTAYASDGSNPAPASDSGNPSISSFIGNAASDTGEIAGAFGQLATHPIKTAQTILSAAGGGIEKLFGVNNQDTQNFDKIVSSYGQKYGGSSVGEVLGNIAHTFYTHPVSTALDFSTLLDGIGAGVGLVGDAADAAKAAELAKASDFISSASGIMKSGSPEAIQALSTPGTITHIADAIKTVADYTNPITPVVKAVGGTANFIGRNVAAPAIGLGTGVGAGTIQEFWNAVTEGGDAAKSATEGLRGAATPEDIVNTAKSSLGDIVDTRNLAHEEMLRGLKTDATNYDISPITKEISNQLQKFDIGVNSDGSLDFSRSAIRFNKAAQGDISTIYNEMQSYGSKPGDNTAIGVNNLKKAFYSLDKPGSDVRSFTTAVAQKTRGVLENAPGYTKEMKSYANLTDSIDEIRKGLSLGDKASVETSFKKITSAFRQNNEYRKAFVDALDSASGGQLAPKIAGQQLNSIMPRGLAKFADTAMTGGLLGGAPVLPILFSMAATSPRLVGEFLKAAALPVKTMNYVIKLLGKAVTPIQLAEIANIAQKANNQ